MFSSVINYLFFVYTQEGTLLNNPETDSRLSSAEKNYIPFFSTFLN